MQRRPVGFASFVCFNFVRLRWLLDLGKGEAVALLDIKHRVVAEDERSAFFLRVRWRLVFLRAAQLLVKNNLCAFLAFAHRTFQLNSLFEREPERRCIGTGPKQENIDAAIGFAGEEIAGKWAAGEMRTLPGLLPRDNASLEALNDAVGNDLVDVGPWGGGCFAHACFLLVFAVAFVVAVACDIHAERHLAKAGGSKRKLRGIPTLEAKQGEAERAKVCTSGARKIGETACARGRGWPP